MAKYEIDYKTYCRRLENTFSIKGCDGWPERPARQKRLNRSLMHNNERSVRESRLDLYREKAEKHLPICLSEN